MPTNKEIKDALDRLFEAREKNLTNEEKEALVDKTMREMVPSYYKLKEAEERFKKTPAYALSELKRFHNHVNDIHNGKAEECTGYLPEGCTENFSMEESKQHMKTIFDELTRLYTEETKE